MKLSAVLMGSHGLTKGSLAFLNYPAQIMFKSTKVNGEEICVFTFCKLKIDSLLQKYFLASTSVVDQLHICYNSGNLNNYF